MTPAHLVTAADDRTAETRSVTGTNLGGITSATSKGLLLPRHLAFDRWVRIGIQLAVLADSSAWCLGDWLVYGEVAYSGRYRDAIEMTSLNYQTLRNYAWVARAFELSRRRDLLSFGHHAELAGLPEPEQDYWLRKAEELRWSCKQLRREVRVSLKERYAATDGDATDGAPIVGPGTRGVIGPKRYPGDESDAEAAADLIIHLDPEERAMCERAAGRSGLTVDMWAVTALAEAARRALSPKIQPGFVSAT